MPEPITLNDWRAANDSAEEAGRAVLDSIRSDLEDLHERAVEAKREGKRGGLADEAQKLEQAIRNAVSALGAREPEEGNGEAVDSELAEQVKAARAEHATQGSSQGGGS